MSIPLIRCTGQCKSKKAAFLFAPSDVRSKYPVCRLCKREKRGIRVNAVQRGSAWKKGWARLNLTGVA
jgi:hypothetical protein